VLSQDVYQNVLYQGMVVQVLQDFCATRLAQEDDLSTEEGDWVDMSKKVRGENEVFYFMTLI
jgi:hypothetical protein